MKRYLVALALVLPLPILIAYQALISPEIEFLRPSLVASWIVHPVPTSLGFWGKGYRPPRVFFFVDFDLSNSSEKSSLRVTSLGEFEITINDERLDQPPGPNWKFGNRVEIGPLLEVGSNRIRISVSNPNGPPALLVEASNDLPIDLNSGTGWSVGHRRRPSRAVSAVIATEGEAYLADRRSPRETSRYYPVYLSLFGVIVLTMVYAIAPLGMKPWLKAKDSPEALTRSSLRICGLLAGLFAVVAIVQIRVAASFDSSDQMPDAIHHLDYVRYIATSWRAPLPEEGWQMYHPPLFYFVSALISVVATWLPVAAPVEGVLQVFSTLTGLGTIIVAGAFVSKLLPKSRPVARIAGFAVAAFLPIGFYMNPHITNEVFAGCVISSTYLLASILLFDRPPNWKTASLLGIVAGLGMLSKYTGLFVVLSIMALLTLRFFGCHEAKERRRILVYALQFAGVVLLVCGWLYARNYSHYGDPFIGNWDSASGFQYEQLPGYRTAGFYDPSRPFLWQEPERARWSAFWGGVYATLWMDVNGFVVDRDNVDNVLLGSLILWLALIPTLGIAIGFLLSCRFLLRESWDHPLFLLVTGGIWTLSALVLFTLEVPFVTTVAGYFLLSLIPAIGVFSGMGLDWMFRRTGRIRYLIYADLAGLCALILYVYSFR